MFPAIENWYYRRQVVKTIGLVFKYNNQYSTDLGGLRVWQGTVHNLYVSQHHGVVCPGKSGEHRYNTRRVRVTQRLGDVCDHRKFCEFEDQRQYGGKADLPEIYHVTPKQLNQMLQEEFLDLDRYTLVGGKLVDLAVVNAD